MKLAHYVASSLLPVGTAAAGQSIISIGKLRLPTLALSTAQVMPAIVSALITLGVLYQSACDNQAQT